MGSDIFSILAFILLIATTGFAYSFASSKNRFLRQCSKNGMNVGVMRAVTNINLRTHPYV